MPANGTHTQTHDPRAVNRKKQKRREKEAAKRAAQEPPSAPAPARNGMSPSLASGGQDYADPGLQYDDEGDYYSDEVYENGEYQEGYDHVPMQSGAGKKPRRKKKAPSGPPPHDYPRRDRHHSPAPAHAMRSGHAPIPHGMRSGSKNIWNTSTEEERERIREFWLSLGEDERKSLVKIEKEAVLRKMKEQQKHSCSCTVCGRKRTAIEEELEVLYDAYYEELEQYAHHQQDVGSFIPEANYGYASSAPHPRPILNTQQPPGAYDDDDEEEEYDSPEEEEEDSETYDSEISSEGDGYSSGERSIPPNHDPQDFFRFGSSLQVKGMHTPVLVLGAC
jgi:hypothetical protein